MNLRDRLDALEELHDAERLRIIRETVLRPDMREARAAGHALSKRLERAGVAGGVLANIPLWLDYGTQEEVQHLYRLMLALRDALEGR